MTQKNEFIPNSFHVPNILVDRVMQLLKPEEFTRTLQFLGGRSPRGVALHIVETEMFWIHMIVSGGPEPQWPDHEQYTDVESVRRIFAETAVVTKDYLRRLSREEAR